MKRVEGLHGQEGRWKEIFKHLEGLMKSYVSRGKKRLIGEEKMD